MLNGRNLCGALFAVFWRLTAAFLEVIDFDLPKLHSLSESSLWFYVEPFTELVRMWYKSLRSCIHRLLMVYIVPVSS